MRAYFRSLKCEEQKQGSWKRIMIEGRRTRPDMNLNEDQVANQLYAIKTKKLYEAEIKLIEVEVGIEVNNLSVQVYLSHLSV